MLTRMARRVLGGVVAAAYLVLLARLTLWPLPANPVAFCANEHTGGLSLYPLAFVDYVLREMSGYGPLRGLVAGNARQVVGNVAIFVPCGLLVRCWLGRGVVAATVAGMAVSLAIEITQLTGLWGAVPCAYRYADVNDVFLNTTGAILGACLARRPGRPSTLTTNARWTGMILDATALAWTTTLLLFLWRLPLALRRTADDPLPGTWLLATLPAWVVVFAIPGLLGRGSVGQALAGIRPTWPHREWWPRLGRTLVVPGPYLLATLVFGPTPEVEPWALVWLLPAAAALALVPATRGRSLSGTITAVRYEPVRPWVD